MTHGADPETEAGRVDARTSERERERERKRLNFNPTNQPQPTFSDQQTQSRRHLKSVYTVQNT